MKPCQITALLVLVSSDFAFGESKLTHVDVFTSRQEGYYAFRIPAIETAPDGSLLAVAEGRKHNRSDPGVNHNDIDLVQKRSTDGGKTWSTLQVVEDPGEKWSACNPVTVVDRTTGRILLLYTVTKPDRSSTTARPGTDDIQTWFRSSDDNGVSWSEPIDITTVARDVENWGGSFFGPGGAIQDRNGRLIVPLSHSTGRQNAGNEMVGGPWIAFVIYSDDHGETWSRGDVLPEHDSGGENQLVELVDGRILMEERQSRGCPHRWMATSRDGGETWSEPYKGFSVTPVACAIERYTLKSAGDDRNRIVWTGPKGPDRAKLVVRTSYDEGRSFPDEVTITEEKAAYSDMTILKDKTVGVLWERAHYGFITFSRFDVEFLESANSASSE